jgi:hypothetical protein
MSILDERELTDVERAAIADEPRPGIWMQDYSCSLARFAGDGRALSQHETDCLIARELEADHHIDRDVIAPWRRTVQVEWQDGRKPNPTAPAEQQRGGIHSDPLVRLLAFRAWGDRDRALFDGAGVLAGEQVTLIDTYIVLAWPGEIVNGIASRNAMPGEKLAIRRPDGRATVMHGTVGVRKRTPQPPKIGADVLLYVQGDGRVTAVRPSDTARPLGRAISEPDAQGYVAVRHRRGISMFVAAR